MRIKEKSNDNNMFRIRKSLAHSDFKMGIFSDLSVIGTLKPDYDFINIKLDIFKQK